MEECLVKALDELKAALDGDPRVKKLAALEAAVMKEPRVIELSKKMEAASQAYEDILVYKKESDPEAKSLQMSLYLCKKALDEDPLVAEYNQAYIAVNDLYMALDDQLFGPYRFKTLFPEAH
jgi:cell fate (sporulation/competence/biofilm development) regulator YmcA (YheA/YmcA/DUF963 family)